VTTEPTASGRPANSLARHALVLYDASMKIGRVEGPRLEALEAASSP
jgi:hypothetical protein